MEQSKTEVNHKGSTNEQSTHKMKQLYQEFNSLKTRIASSQNRASKSKDKQPLYRASILGHQSGRNRGKPTENDWMELGLNRPIFEPEAPEKIIFDNKLKQIMRKEIENKVTDIASKLELQYHRKITHFQERLNNINFVLCNLRTLSKKRFTVQPTEQPVHVERGVQTPYLYRMQTHPEPRDLLFENRMKELQLACEKKEEITETSSISKNQLFTLKKELQEEIKFMQEKLLLVETSNNRLSKENSKLNAQLKEAEENLLENNKLIKELTEEVSLKCRAIEKIKVDIQQENRKAQQKTSSYESKLQKVNSKLRKLATLHKQKQNQLREFQKRLNHSEQERNRVCHELKVFKEERNRGLQEIDSSKSNNLDFIVQSYIPEIKPCTHMNRMSLRASGIRYKQPSQNKIKLLESEILLLDQQNKNIKHKKDRFQMEIKAYEEDEERFQQMMAIHRDEEKRLFKENSVLEECALLMLQNKKPQPDKISALQQSSGLRRYYQNIYGKGAL